VQSQRVGTTTIGFGDDFDEELLTAMATGGSTHHAASPDDAPGIFSKEFEDLVSLGAQNLSVEVRGSEYVQVLGVLNEFPCVQVSGGVQAQLGDAYVAGPDAWCSRFTCRRSRRSDPPRSARSCCATSRSASRSSSTSTPRRVRGHD